MATDMFEHTATGVLGDKRCTMLQNQLHRKAELSHPFTRGHQIPVGGDVTFGVATHDTTGGVAEVFNGWKTVASAQDDLLAKLPMKGKTAKTERDFVALNRCAVVAGNVDAKEVANFRATHDVRKEVEQQKSKCSDSVRRIPPTMVFGKPTRPSTPIHDLLEHRFQQQWVEQHREAEDSRRKEEAQTRKKIGQPYQTRTSLLRVYEPPVEAAPLWKISRFTRTAPHLSTFRTPNEKANAGQYFQTDQIARKGTLGQGIYEPAKA